jgi:hypothetical protein
MNDFLQLHGVTGGRSKASASPSAPKNDTPDAYVRPADWLALTPAPDGSNVFRALYAVHDSSHNHVGMSFTMSPSTAQCVVNWGDGTPNEIVNTNVAVFHDYAYGAAALVGTECSRGYRQAIITVTPYTPGSQFLGCQLGILPPKAPIGYCYQFLDIDASMPIAERIFLGRGIPSGTAEVVTAPTPRLERVSLKTPGLLNATYLFEGCGSLEQVVLSPMESCTNMTFMFSGCYSLQYIPPLGGSRVTDFTSAFANCWNLKAIPTINYSSALLMNSAFSNCRAVKVVPDLTFPKATSLTGMFGNCNSLTRLPGIAAASATSASGIFSNCSAATEAGTLELPVAGSISQLFYNCISLKKVEAIKTSLWLSNVSYAFSGCWILEALPLFDTSNVTVFASFATDCRALKTVPLYNTANVTNFSNAFTSCGGLESVPLFNMTKATTVSSMFTGCASLKTIPLFSTAGVTNFSSFLGNCYALVSVPPLDTSGATNLASMLFGCRALATIPLFNTINVTGISSMFYGCVSLVEIPAMNLSAVSTVDGFSNAFFNVASLRSFKATGMRFSFSLLNTMLDADALNVVYTNLPSLSATGQAVTITGSYGASGSSTGIATAKKWGVTN